MRAPDAPRQEHRAPEAVDRLEAAETRRREALRLPALVAALDDLLFELEELNVRGVTEVPDACRRRAQDLVGEAMRIPAGPPLPGTVLAVMDRVHEAEDAALLQRRRAAWGLHESAPRRSA